MTLKEFRNTFPEYDDIEDEDILDKFELEEDDDEKEEEPSIPLLNDIVTELKNLRDTVSAMRFPESTDPAPPIVKLLEKVCARLDKVEMAVKGMDLNVNLPEAKAPIVNIPKNDIVFPEPLKEWTFDIKRDQNGFIAGVVARA